MSQTCYFFFPAPTLAFLIPLTFFCLFLRSFLCFLLGLFLLARPKRICLYWGSNFFRASMLSYTNPNPDDLPPPKAVLKPKHTTKSPAVLYILASCSRISVFGTLALPGCSTSTTIWRRCKSLFVINFLDLMVAVSDIFSTTRPRRLRTRLIMRKKDNSSCVRGLLTLIKWLKWTYS